MSQANPSQSLPKSKEDIRNVKSRHGYENGENEIIL